MHPMILEELRRKKSGGAAKTYATWNPLDKGVYMGLSNENLTATSITANTWLQSTARSTIVKNSGIHSAEMQIFVPTSQGAIAGIMTPTAPLDNPYAQPGVGWYRTGLLYVWGVSSQPSPAAFYNGDYLGFVTDFDAGIIYLYRNGILKSTYSDTRLASNDFLLFFGCYQIGASAILNTGQTSFQYPILAEDGWFV